MATRIKLRNDTAENWTAADPVLAKGEIGLEQAGSVWRAKIGNGISRWSVLPYSLEAEGGGAATFAELTDKATADLPAINGPLASALAGKETAGAAAAAQAYSIQRANHNGTQAQTTIVNLVSDLAAKASLAGNNTFTGQQSFSDAATWVYTPTSKAAHLAALGATTTGTELFQAATAAAARTTLMGEILNYDPNAGTTQTNPASFVDDDTLVGVALTAGLWEISYFFRFNIGTCGIGLRLLFGTPANVNLVTGNSYGIYVRGNQAPVNQTYTSATGSLGLIGIGTGTALNGYSYLGTATVLVSGNTTLGLQYSRSGSGVAGETITRLGNSFIRARKVNQ